MVGSKVQLFSSLMFLHNSSLLLSVLRQHCFPVISQKPHLKILIQIDYVRCSNQVSHHSEIDWPANSCAINLSSKCDVSTLSTILNAYVCMAWSFSQFLSTLLCEDIIVSLTKIYTTFELGGVNPRYMLLSKNLVQNPKRKNNCKYHFLFLMNAPDVEGTEMLAGRSHNQQSSLRWCRYWGRFKCWTN